MGPWLPWLPEFRVSKTEPRGGRPPRATVVAEALRRTHGLLELDAGLAAHAAREARGDSEIERLQGDIWNLEKEIKRLENEQEENKYAIGRLKWLIFEHEANRIDDETVLSDLVRTPYGQVVLSNRLISYMPDHRRLAYEDDVSHALNNSKLASLTLAEYKDVEAALPKLQFELELKKKVLEKAKQGVSRDWKYPQRQSDSSYNNSSY